MKIEKIFEAGNRAAVLMEHESLRICIDAGKGMVPELSTRYKNGWINAHWNPWFRANSGKRWNTSEHSGFWKAPLLYDIAGNFPCIPNFGSDFNAGDYHMPPHGFTAAETWKQDEPEENLAEEHLVLKSSLQEGVHPFRYKKTDLLLKEQNIHYTLLNVLNTGAKDEPYNYGWHNTVGAPFLESGCLIDNSAEVFAVPPQGGEFDTTGCLAFGAETNSLRKVPLRDGSYGDFRIVQGVTGYTDFISGAVSKNSEFIWSSIVNPRLKLVYLSFAKGPAAVKEFEIPLYFHDLWLNYGGRPYTPWAVVDGQTDMTFCLGAENATGFFANGLEESKRNPVLLGNPTHLILPPGERRTLEYATLFRMYDNDSLDEGVARVDIEDNHLVLTGYNGKYLRLKADWNFDYLRKYSTESP